MRVTTTDIPGVLLIEPDVFRDPRGLFLETYHARRYADAGIPGLFVQDNYSQSMRGTLRGLHYQDPQAQGKLVMVTEGAVYDVVVDIRKGSPSFCRWYGAELSAENRCQVYVPSGCAHGFCVTSDRASFLYKCTDYYAPSDERGIIWNDPSLAIPWPVATPILSAKDRTYKSLAEMGSELPRYRPVG
ncbi:MAG: dTDP-4-dehydrorhamnose 3,5-epimerase [Nitrospirae bacterium]|nr:MAG: dTDP-4-dehydrorhamnose 3,5-epimerase [Nitrospirota bacterium]